MFNIIRQYPKAFLWAIAVHGVFLVVMGVSFTFSDARLTSIPDSDVIRAVTIDPIADKRKAAEKKRIENKRRDEKKRKAAEKKRVEKAIALKKKKAEQKSKADKKHKEKELKKQLEQEEKQRQEQTRRETELKKEMAEEQARLAKERRKQQVTIIDKYRALIDRQIRKNWHKPAVAKPGMVCKIKVKLIPSGEVIEMRIVSSSGDSAFDRSVENAIRKSSPLPLPSAENGLFEEFREIEITFWGSPQNKR